MNEESITRDLKNIWTMIKEINNEIKTIKGIIRADQIAISQLGVDLRGLKSGNR